MVGRVIVYAITGSLITALAQQTRNDGAFLYEACSVVASAPGDPPKISPELLPKAMFCFGYLHAIHAALLKIHDYYKWTFPTYGQWKTDETFVNGWLATQVLLAADVCFPNNMRTKTLAMIISKYGKEHPEDLTKNMFDFAGFVFQSAYPPSRSESCARKD